MWRIGQLKVELDWLNKDRSRSCRVEFYEVEVLALITEELNRQLERWERTDNCVRPHETLDYLPPNEYDR